MNVNQWMRSVVLFSVLEVVTAGLLPAKWMDYAASYDGSYDPTSTTPPGGQSTWAVSGTVTANVPLNSVATIMDVRSTESVSLHFPVATGYPSLPSDCEYTFYTRLLLPTTAGVNVQGSSLSAVVNVGFKDEGGTGKTVMLGWFNGASPNQYILALTDANGGLGTGAVTINTTNYFDGQFHDYHVRKYQDAVSGAYYIQVYVDGIAKGNTVPYASLANDSGSVDGFGVFTSAAGLANVQIDELQFGTVAPEPVVLNAGQEVSTGGRNDHQQLKSFFSSASMQFLLQQSLIDSVFVPLGCTSARAINVDADSDWSGGLFVPCDKLKNILAAYRANSWKPHLIVGLKKPLSFPENISTWTQQNWTDYASYASSYISYAACQSSARQLVADRFEDGEYLSNPTWTALVQNPLTPWTVDQGALKAPLKETSLQPTIGISFAKLNATASVYISLDVCNPYPSGDYQPIVFNLVGADSISGYSVWGNPKATVYGGTSGFGWSQLGANPSIVGVTGAAMGTVQYGWDHLLIKIDPVANTVAVTKNGQIVLSVANAVLASSITQFQISNRSIIPWKIKNFYIGHKPQDPAGDNFESGSLATWEILEQDMTHPWTVSSGTLILPNGTATKSRIRLGLNPGATTEPWQISFDIKYPYAPADYQPIALSIVQRGSAGTPSKGYNIWANPLVTAYGTSGFGYVAIPDFNTSTYNTSPSAAGVAGEALGKFSYYGGTSHWENVRIQLDVDNRFKVYRNDRLVLTFSNSLGITQMDDFHISNQKGIVPWQIDNVYSWYGSNPRPEILFEVENEPDLTIDRWWIPKGASVTQGGQAVFDYYFNLYKIWADAVADYNRHSFRPIFIGGPAASAGTFVNNYPINWFNVMASTCLAYDTRLDLLTMHFYGENGKIAGKSTPRFAPFQDQIASLKSGLASATRFGATRLGITEWGPSYNVKDGLTSQGMINGDNTGSAWSAAFLIDMIDNGVDFSVMLLYKDFAFDSAPTQDNYTWPSFYTMDGQFPKPLYNVAKLFTLMPGTRRLVDVKPGQGMGAYATSDTSGHLAVLVYNYDWNYTLKSSESIVRSVIVYYKGVTAGATYTVTPYVIDATHANSGQYWKGGLPIQTAGSILTAGSSISVTATSDGIIKLPKNTLPAASVTLWLISKQ